MPWPLSPLRLDQFGRVGEAADVHAEPHARVERGQPPGLGGAHRHAHRAEAMGIDLGTAGEVVERADLVEHHHPVEHLAVPEHQLEGVFLSDVSVRVPFALAETPAVDRERHQTVFHAHRRIGRLHVDAAKQLLLAQVVHAAVPVDVQQARSGRSGACLESGAVRGRARRRSGPGPDAAACSRRAFRWRPPVGAPGVCCHGRSPRSDHSCLRLRSWNCVNDSFGIDAL